MDFWSAITDETSRNYVRSLPIRQARYAEWHVTQRMPCPILAWCPKCYQYKVITDFYVTKNNSASGRKNILKEKQHTTCKSCQAQRYQDTDDSRKLFYAARQRATTKGIEFDLTVNDIKIPEHCPALGLKLQPVHGKACRDSSPSLDRIDNSKGYVKGNIAVISFRANTLKNNATAEELRAIADYIDSLKDNLC